MAFVETMTPVLVYGCIWNVTYWLVHLASLELFPWYKSMTPVRVAYYSKKLRLAKKSGITAEKEARIATEYFQNFFTTSILSSLHGIVLAFLLVPFTWTNFGFLLEAKIGSTTDSPAGDAKLDGVLAKKKKKKKKKL